MKYCRNLNECFEPVPEAVNANKWANNCKIAGWVIVGLFSLVGIIIAADAYDAGFGIFLSIVAGGFLIASGFWILGAVLDALASSAQSNAETARMTYLQMRGNSGDGQARTNEQRQRQHMEEERAFQTRVNASASSAQPKPQEPATRWFCVQCGMENTPYDNVCNNCGAKKVD